MMKYKIYIQNYEFPESISEYKIIVDGILINVQQIENYEKVIDNLRSDLSINDTAIFEIDSILEEEFILESVLKLNILLSISRGNTINLSHYEVFNDKGELKKPRRRPPISSNFNHQEVIPRKNYQDNIEFIKNGLTKYEELHRIYNLKKIARENALGRSNALFINSRGTLLSILIEYIINVFTDKFNSRFIIDNDIFKESLDNLKKDFQESLKNTFGETISCRDISKLTGKITNINDKALISKYKSFRKYYNCPITQNEFEQFIKIRNSLAHTGNFPNEKYNLDYFFFLLKVIDRIILSMFDYKGGYCDRMIKNEVIFGKSG